MSKISIILLFCLALPSLCFSYGRSGDLADPSFHTTGDEAVCFSVSIDTASPTLVYDSNNTGFWDREVLLQNTSSDYDVYCGTSSTGFTDSAGPRFLLPKNPSGFTTNVRADFYCIVESAAAANTVDIVGIVEYDSRD